jgi:hypothetical protein
MPTRLPHLSCRKLGVSSFLTFFLLFLTASPAAFGQWTATDAQTAFSDFNNAFYFNPSDDNYDYRLLQGSTSYNGFWVQANLIEMAVDAYNQNPTSANQNIINQLCNGFTAQYTGNWSSDSYDDDLMWATIAFTLAAKATGNPAWLADAETNFAVVWSRGYDATLGGGIWWNAAAANTSSGYKNSAANWTFVIAGNLLYHVAGPQRCFRFGGAASARGEFSDGTWTSTGAGSPTISRPTPDESKQNCDWSRLSPIGSAAPPFTATGRSSCWAWFQVGRILNCQV